MVVVAAAATVVVVHDDATAPTQAKTTHDKTLCVLLSSHGQNRILFSANLQEGFGKKNKKFCFSFRFCYLQYLQRETKEN